MGRPKLSVGVGGVALARRVYDVLASQCGEVVIVGMEHVPGVGDVRQVPDLRPGRGPLAGMEAGMGAVRHPLVFVAAGDLPFLSQALVGFLLGRVAAGALAAVPMSGGRPHPLCAAYDRGILPDISSALDDGVGAVRTLLQMLEGVEYVDEELRRFGDPATFLMNVNTPGDLDYARTLLRESRL